MIAARFLLVYFFTAVIDYTAFFLAFRATGSVLASQIAGRLFSVPFNYFAVRSKVFESSVRHETAGPKFVVLYVAAFLLAWALIEAIAPAMPLSKREHQLLAAKMIAEGSILAVKFFALRRFVFTGGKM